MDDGGEWKNELWAEFRSERRIKLLFRGAGAHPWILERRNGLARGVYKRRKADDPCPSKQILADAQWCLRTLISGGAFSAYQMVFGSNPVDLFG